jgi:hypothetical protein
MAVSENHLQRIHAGQPPQYDSAEHHNNNPGTRIRIYGYNHNDGSKLNHEQLRDYIVWFTKFGSIERLLWDAFPKHVGAKARLTSLTLQLRGLGFDGSKHGKDGPAAKSEKLTFGHLSSAKITCAYPKPKPGRIDDGASRGSVSAGCPCGANRPDAACRDIEGHR